MNAKAFLEVEMPPAVARLEKDRRGYPIPYTVMYVNGVPDFTMVDPEKWVRLTKIKGCGICGKPLTGRMFFVGGPRCLVNMVFFDHPMHEECAVYALKVCPFLCMPNAHYRRRVAENVEIIKSVSDQKPEVFMLGESRGYSLVRNGQEVLLQAKPWENVRWWKDGVDVTDRVEIAG